MSLFDIIKYKHTDLDEYDALFELPDKLIRLFWVKGHESINSQVYFEPKHTMCNLLSKWLRNDPETKIILKTEAFNKALKEYSNVNI